MSYTWIFFFFCLFRATHLAYGGSQATGQIRAYATATATPDPSCLCDLHHNSGQCWILNPLGKARDWTCILMDVSWVLCHWTIMGTPTWIFLRICLICVITKYIFNVKALLNTQCYGLNMPPQNSYVEALTCKVMVFGERFGGGN